MDASRQFLSSSGFLKIYYKRLLLVENIFNKHSLLSASTAYVLKLYAQKLAISSIINAVLETESVYALWSHV